MKALLNDTLKDHVGKKRAGLLLTIIITFVVFVIYFGTNPITHLKTNYFNDGGDLMKDVYATTYHVKYDTSYLHCEAMSYPYGDYYIYDGIVPYISFPIKLLHDAGVTQAPDYVNATMALLVIVSIFLCALFLFLLLNELGLHVYLSILAAVAITFLSPQLDRIGAHLTLSFPCFYPMMIYFLVRHYKTAKLKYCLFFGIVMLFAGMSHPYFLVTFAYISVIYCIFIYFKDRQRFNGLKGTLTCLLLQFLLPSVLFFILCNFGDTSTDRTSIPWGFYEYRGRFEGLLFFRGCPPKWWHIKKPVEWESICYIGSVSRLMLLVIVIEMIVTTFKKKFKDVFAITDNPVLNVLFYAALLMAVVCCTIPEIFSESILKYIGPLAQMRAVGRFLLLSYYVINVISLYLIFNFSKKLGGKLWSISIIVLTLGLFAFDVNRKCECYKVKFNKDIPKLSDVNNTLDINQWVNEIDRTQYQAILTLPFIHVGSEHITLNSSQQSVFDMMYVSLKTGLPLMSNNSSRAPIKNTYKIASIAMFPIVDYPFLEDLPQKKPLLVIVSDSSLLKDNDKRILGYSSFLTKANRINFYSLEIDSLYKLCSDFRHELYEKAQEADSTNNCFYENWDSMDGYLPCRLDEKTVIFDGNLPTNDSSFTISFWFSDYLEDLSSKSRITVNEVDSSGLKTEIKSSLLLRHNIAVYDGWGLIEFIVNTSGKNRHLKIALDNMYEPHRVIKIDNLLIRPGNTHAVTKSEDQVFYNNLPVVICD